MTVEDVGLHARESPQRQTIATCCNVPDAGGHINNATADVATLNCCRKAHIPPNCVAQTAWRIICTKTCCLCAFVPSARQSAVALGP
ncbi:hypothetical protein AVEN_83720-1 [Araneus ventricosus]|uniref:Uncharacterized protein n=1 Tax=Araneus ventricosus TaxID=182803 RepID=A0A4Y2EX15_ARAVE|nr:hypothetical protein AVEN_83720-1 [Araneus ventricosus]